MPPFLLHPEVPDQGDKFPAAQGDTYHGFGPTRLLTPCLQLRLLQFQTALINFRAGAFLKVRAARGGPAVLLLIPLFARFFSIAFPRQSLFQAALLARLQIEGMPLDFLDNVFLLDFAFEPAQGVFKRLALLNPNFGQ
jgi:hypothetical protein